MDPAAAPIVFSWAILLITVLFVAAAAWRHDTLVQAFLVCGDTVHHLLVGVEDPMGPLGGLTGHGLCHCLVQRHVLLSEEVVLQLHVSHPIDDQAKDDWLTVVEFSLAGQVGAGELHVALPGLGLEVCEEALHGLAWLLPDSMELCGPCLHGLLGQAAGDDVLEDDLLVEVLELGPEAAAEHLRHVRSEALKEPGGAVPVVPKPLLVLLVLVAEVVVLLLVSGLAT
jgi:hypothetical protein